MTQPWPSGNTTVAGVSLSALTIEFPSPGVSLLCLLGGLIVGLVISR